MRFLLVLFILFTGQMLNAQEEVEEAELEEPLDQKRIWLKKVQNEDGSFGEKDKQIITAMALIDLTANAETVTSVHYGEIIKKAISYLVKESNKELTPLQCGFMLYCFQELHAYTASEVFPPLIANLKLKLIKQYEGDHWKVEENEVYTNLLCVLGFGPMYEGDNSTSKKIYDRTLKWISEQNGQEAQICSLYLTESRDKEESAKADLLLKLKLGQKINNYVEHLLLTKLFFKFGGRHWKQWNRFHQKAVFDLQLEDGTWPSKPLSGLLSDHELDNKIFNTFLVSWGMTVYYRYLPSSIGGRAGKLSLSTRMSANERYLKIKENGIRNPLHSPLSTFSVDVDTASYANVRGILNTGELPPRDAVRIEEMLNYFTYERSGINKDIFDINFEMAPCPWEKRDMLLKTTLSTEKIDLGELPAKNLVFLIDVSGSMAEDNKLPLLKKALNLLVFELKKEDRVSIVTYAGRESVVLNAASGDKHFEIIKALDNLTSGGGTNGSSGIEKAYELARENFIKDGINRVLLCTDGDFNIGISDHESLMKLIAEKAKSNVFLTVMGFGRGNLRDDVTEQLADKGNGQAFYIDTLLEAKKALVDEMGASLNTVAKDVKLQLEFNPAMVENYRLIGYENRILNAEDFEDDKVDAGEIGSGHQVTALYQLTLRGASVSEELSKKQLKYQDIKILNSAEMLTYKIRYKKPDQKESQYFECVFNGEVTATPSPDWNLASSIAMYGLLLRDSEYKGKSSYALSAELCKDSLAFDKKGYRKELLNSIEKAADISQALEKEAQENSKLDLVE